MKGESLLVNHDFFGKYWLPWNAIDCNGFRTEFEITFENFNVVVQSHCWCRNLLLRKKNGWTGRSKKKWKLRYLTSVENYLRHQKLPDGISTKGDKANFRRACKKFSVSNGHLMYKGNK